MNQPAFKHQDFSISSIDRLKVVRQDRYYPNQSEHFISFNGIKYMIENYSAFGIALKGFNRTETSAKQCIYLVDNIEICIFDMAFVRSDENLKLTMFNIENQPLPIEAIQAIEATKVVISSFEKDLSKFCDVPISFRQASSEFKGWIEQLEIKINNLQKSSFTSSKHDLDQYEESIAHFVSKYLIQNIQQYCISLGLSIAGLEPEKTKMCYEYLRTQVGNIFYKSPYGNRAFNKPRGYAGDFEMMNNVYFNELRGETLFAKCVQRFFTDNPAGKAVRNRVIYLNEKIEKCNIRNLQSKILGVASGPAREIQKFFQDSPDRASKCEIHLLDQDADALKFSQKAIYEICRNKGVQPNIYFHNLAIKNIIAEGLPLSGFDLIYSAGLFDYFTDPVAHFAAKQLYSALAKEGELVIGNFDANNPAQFIMEALGDWYLIYRDKNKLRELYGTISPKLVIESEEEGVNLFAILRK